MTIILGMYYNNKKGALIASDSQASYESTYYQARKIIEINNILFSCAGSIFIENEFLESVKSELKDLDNQKKFKKGDVRESIREAQINAIEKYPKKKYKDAQEIAGVVGFYIDQPEIYHLINEGGTSLIKDCYSTGIGWEFVEKILRKEYSVGITKEKAMRLAAYCIFENAADKFNVDNNIQIATIEEEGNNIIGLNENGTLNLYNPKISKLKKRAEEISKAQWIQL
jgi:20S proteasome alpha/beta subunit